MYDNKDIIINFICNYPDTPVRNQNDTISASFYLNVSLFERVHEYLIVERQHQLACTITHFTTRTLLAAGSPCGGGIRGR